LDVFFIHFGSVIAWFCTIWGIVKMAFGFFLAYKSETQEQMAAAAKHYLGANTTGEAINEGMYMMAFGVMAGVLVQIAKNTKKK
jgi:hypothetical protein